MKSPKRRNEEVKARRRLRKKLSIPVSPRAKKRKRSFRVICP